MRCIAGAATLGLPAGALAAEEEADPRVYAGVLAPEAPAEEPPAPEVVAPQEAAADTGPSETTTTTATTSAPPPPKKKKRNTRIPKINIGKKGAVMQPWIRQTLFTEWYRENYNIESGDDNFVTLVTRTNIGQDTRTQKATIGTQIRVDGQKIWFPSGQDCGGGTCVPIEDDLRLERTTLRVDTKHVSVYAGDFNVQMGRGMGLSVRKIDEIGVDATIKGGRVDVRTKPIRAMGMAGFSNRQNSDFATRQLIPDAGFPARSYTFAPAIGDGFCDVEGSLDDSVGNRFWSVCSDFVGGARLEGTLPGRVDLGANYGYIDFGEELTPGVIDEYMHTVGGDVSRARIAKVWDLYVGGMGIFRNPNLRGTEFASEGFNGYGIYGSNTFVLGTTTLLLEGKHYENYMMATQQISLLQYTENPTLEREDQQVPGNYNATGGRARLDHTWRDAGVTLFVNTLEYAYAENRTENQFDGEDGGRLATHNYGGLIYRKPHSDFVLQASGGYRYERWLEPQGGSDSTLRRKFPHGEVYISIPVGQSGDMTHSLSVRGEGRWETFVTAAQREVFFRGLFTLGYSLSPWFSVSYLQGVDTEIAVPPGEPSLTTERCEGGQGSTCRPHLWPGVQVKINLFNSSFIRIFGGRQVGGRVCVNGSCRTLPDFEGVRSELVFSF